MDKTVSHSDMIRYKKLMDMERPLTYKEREFLNEIDDIFNAEKEKEKEEKKTIAINKGGLLKKDKSSKKMMGGGKVKKPYTASNKRYAHGGKVSGRKPKYKG